MGIADSNKIGKRIGIVGLGSIGITHCIALEKLGIKEISALRTGKGKKNTPLSLEHVVTNVYNIQEFSNVDAFIIANPTSLHLETLGQLLAFNKPIFIEKPLCATFEEALQIFKTLKNVNLKIQIGFCLRFHPIFIAIKKIIESGILGNIYHARLEVGHYLPNWHPYTDYRDEYFAKKELGGGVIRTLSHEIDLAQFLFGSPGYIKAYINKISELNINVDDYNLILLKYDNKIVKLEMDFLQKRPKRKGIILGSELDLEYNLFDHTICLFDNKGNLMETINPEIGDMYLSQMRTFLDDDINGSFATIEESIHLMKIINKAETYTNELKWEKL